MKVRYTEQLQQLQRKIRGFDKTMAHNPFKYVPKLACELKAADKKTRKHRKLLRAVVRNPLFTEKLTECLIKDSEQSRISALKNKFIYESQNTLLFVSVGLATIFIASVLRLGVLGESAIRYSLYALVASVMALPFIAFYAYKSNSRMNQLAEVYLERFTVPNDKFTPEYMQHLVELSTTAKDIIPHGDLDKRIPCGCYGCKSLYTSNALISNDYLGEYVCPNCGKTSIISEKCGEHITQELIDDLYEYWKE